MQKRKQYSRAITTFNIHIPETKVYMKICFSGTDQDEQDLEELYRLKDFTGINGSIKPHPEYLEKLLINRFEKQIKKKFNNYLKNLKDYKLIINLIKEAEKKVGVKNINTYIKEDRRFRNFTRTIKEDIVEYGSTDAKENMSSLINKVIKEKIEELRNAKI